MSLTTAQKLALNLAATLMVTVVLIQVEGGGYSVMLATEFDGEPASIIFEYDPFAR